MTPTLVGRWQTRLAMLGTLGLLVTATFAAVYGALTPFWILLWLCLLGLGWDVIFILIQVLRWDRDWPAAFQVASAILEGSVLYAIITVWGLPGVPQGGVAPSLFLAHYGTVWLVTFIWVQGPMRAFFPFWRFHGGRIIPAVTSSPALRISHGNEPAPPRHGGRPLSLTVSVVILLLLGLLAVAGGVLFILGRGPDLV